MSLSSYLALVLETPLQQALLLTTLTDNLFESLVASSNYATTPWKFTNGFHAWYLEAVYCYMV